MNRLLRRLCHRHQYIYLPACGLTFERLCSRCLKHQTVVVLAAEPFWLC